MIKKYNKLVRDNITKIIRENGDYARTKRKLTDEEFIVAVKKKIVEEAMEVKNAQTKEEIIEELADLSEIMLTLANIYKITLEDVNTTRLKKNEEKGSFNKRVFLKYTYTDEDIENQKRGCETCALKNKCDAPDNIDNLDSDRGRLCIDYIPDLKPQKVGKPK